VVLGSGPRPKGWSGTEQVRSSVSKWFFVFGEEQPVVLSNLQSQASRFKGDGEVQPLVVANLLPQTNELENDGGVQAVVMTNLHSQLKGPRSDGEVQPVGATNLQSRAKLLKGAGEERRRLRPSLLSQAFLLKGDGEEQGVPGTSAALSAAAYSAPCKRARALAPAALVPGSGAWPRAGAAMAPGLRAAERAPRFGAMTPAAVKTPGLKGSSDFEAAQSTSICQHLKKLVLILCVAAQFLSVSGRLEVPRRILRGEVGQWGSLAFKAAQISPSSEYLKEPVLTFRGGPDQLFDLRGATDLLDQRALGEADADLEP
jgi:hypothetical protein